MVAATKLPSSASPNLNAKFEVADIDKVTPDPGQPRKTFDQAKLGELAESIKVHGVIVPLEVRAHPAKGDGWFMIVAGERRWRAAKLAGLTQVPVLIVELAPELVLEHQLIENSQREDVPPLEEAEAYDALMKKHGYTMERLIQKTGRSKAHLYGRLKLIDLAPGAKKAMQSGELVPTIAELIARIPDVKLQEQATKDVLGKSSYNVYNEAQVTSEQIRDDKHGGTQQPLSFRAAVQLLRKRYQTQFDLRKFDPVDKSLVPKAGACTECPFRAGNQPALPGLTPAKGVDDDYCTKPACFEQKVEAHFNEKAKDAQTRGLKVIDGAAAKKIIPYHSGSLAHDANYADPKDTLPYNVARPGSNATFGSLLGKKLDEVPRVFVQDPSTGVGRELLVKDKAIEKLRELGKLEKAPKKKSSSSGSSSVSAADRKRQDEREKKKQALHEATVLRVLEQVATNAAKDPGAKELPLWRWLARAVIGEYGGNELLEQRRELEGKAGRAVEAALEKTKTIGEVRSLLMEYLIAEAADRGTGSYPNKHHKETFEDGCKLLGADWDKAAAAAKAAYEAEEKSDAAKDAKKAPAKKGKAK